MATRIPSSIQSKIKFFEDLKNAQQLVKVAKRDPTSVQNRSRRRWTPKENKIGSFVKEKIRTLCPEVNDVDSSKSNAPREHKSPAAHYERLEEDELPDLDLVESGKRSNQSKVHYPTGLQITEVTQVKQNSSKESKNVTKQAERLETYLQSDLDLSKSSASNDRSEVTYSGLELDQVDLQTSGKDCQNQSPSHVSIGNMSVVKVENFNQMIPPDDKDCRPSLFRIRLEFTEREVIKKGKRIVSTVAMQKVLETLDIRCFAGVRGDKCSGKTSVLYGVIRSFMKQHTDWNAILVTREDHLQACYKEKKVLIVVDDICDQNEYVIKHLADMQTCTKRKCWMVIFSYSNESYEKYRSKLKKDNMLDGGHVLNISRAYECTDDEKIKILNSHCECLGYELAEETCRQCVKLVPTKYFFYYVKGYIMNKEHTVEGSVISFFQTPIVEIVQDLEHLKQENFLGFHVLFCCSSLGHSMFDIANQFQMQLNEPAIEISEWLLTNYNQDHTNCVQQMQREVKGVPKSFIQHIENNKYRIEFNCVIAAVKLIILIEFNSSAVNSDNLFRLALSLCDLTLLRQFVESDKNVSRLHKHDKMKHLVDRFVYEITNGNVETICKHPLFSNDDFKCALINKFRNKCDENYIWDIFSKLDNNLAKALIVFVVENDTPDRAGNLTEFILESKKWKKYSRKEGRKIDRQLLVLKQNMFAIKSAKAFIDDDCLTHTTLIESVFKNVRRISQWVDYQQREEAIRSVIEVQGLVLSERSTDGRSEIHKEVVELFQNIKIKAHINEKKQSLLQLCVICENKRFLKWAVEQRKEEINRRDCCGQTPLHSAVQRDNISAVRILIKSGAVIEIKDKDGNTALHFAVNSNKDILNILIRVNGTDVNVTNKQGKTPLHLARELQKKEHIQILGLADVNYE